MKRQLLWFTLALFMVKAVMAQSNPPSTNSQNAAVGVNNSGEYVECYGDGYHDHVNYYTNRVVAGTFDHDFTMNWADGGGGTNFQHWLDTGISTPWWSPAPDFYEEYDTNIFPATFWPEPLPDTGGGPYMFDGGNGSYIVSHNALMGLQSCVAKAKFNYISDGELWADETFDEAGQAGLTLATGGEPGSTNVNLWMISASATKRAFVPSGQQDDPPVGMDVGAIPFTKIIAGVFGQLDEQGNAFMLLPDNARADITPYVAGEDYYTFNDPPGPVTLTGLTVVSNAVAVGGTNNWAAVKATNEYVYVKATLSTEATNAANQIVWSVGEKVSYDPFQRKVSKAASVKYIVTATLGSTNKTVNVWIIWATVLPRFTNNLSPGDPLNFPSWCSGNTLGPWNNIATSPPAQVGYKVELVGQITPAGVGAVVKTGWAFEQNTSTRSWFNSTNYTDSSGLDSWDSDFEYDTPNGSDQIFLIDCPSDGSASGTAYFKEAWNFATRVKWNSQVVSDYALWFVRVKARPSSGTYIIDTCTAGDGNPTFDINY